MSVENKVALVTGASRGIGRAIAMRLAQQGLFVVGTATTEAGAEKITAYFEEAQLSGQGMQLDIRDSEMVQTVVDKISTDIGAPAILVNNAAVTQDNLLLRMTDEEWENTINTDLNSVFRVTKACLRSMFKQRWGRVINISSVVGSTGNAGQVNYSAAKAGILGFSKSLAKEVGSRGITINVVSPGFIETDMTKDLPDQQREALLGQIPLKRLGQPEDIAQAVAFLVSDAAAYITGETLHINGGMYMA